MLKIAFKTRQKTTENFQNIIWDLKRVNAGTSFSMTFSLFFDLSKVSVKMRAYHLVMSTNVKGLGSTDEVKYCQVDCLLSKTLTL